jgi:hypothetical protein
MPLIGNVFQLFSVVYLWLAMTKELDNDETGAAIMVLWAIYFIITAVFFKLDEKR